MCDVLCALLRDESAVTAIEYGLIASFIAMVCVVIWTSVGSSLSNVFSTVNNAL
jgi:pilus assembly protein Flp/PilA